MNKLYEKNGLLFAIFWIIVYVVGLSIADNLSAAAGIQKSVTVIVGGVLTFILIKWMKSNQLLEKYGICKPTIETKKLLYYIPLVLLASVNLWLGVAWNLSVLETGLYIVAMLFVGVLEEIIFRGLLFTEMCKEGVKSAMIVSSVTFGIGHIVNLINGSGANFFSSLLQVIYATAAGFLFTILFYKTKSLWACIITHGMLNALSVFENQSVMTPMIEVGMAIALIVISSGYALYIVKIDG